MDVCICVDCVYRDWLNKWDDVHLRKTLKIPFGNKENPGAKSALLSGPPGIGKTSIQ